MPTALGMEVVTVGERRARARVERTIDGSFSSDGRSIVLTLTSRRLAEVPFRAFTGLDDLNREALAINREHFIRTRINCLGNGLFTTLSFGVRRDSTPEAAKAKMTGFGPLPVWVVDAPELLALEEKLGLTWPDRPDLPGPRFELVCADDEWSVQWWPQGGGMASAPSLRGALASVPPRP
jgi:hypothetical protein